MFQISRSKIWRTVFCLTCVCCQSDAQTILGTGAVSGTVHDESGLPIADASVFLADELKRLARSSLSDHSGFFLFPSVIAGTYTLRVQKEGFRTQQMSGVAVAVGEHASIPVTLRVGEVHTAVVVRVPEIANLDSESNMLGSVVGSKQVQNLPLNGRHFLQLALLTGGTTEISAASDLFTGNVGPPSRAVVLPGTLPYSVGYSLNGINIRGSRDGELALSPSVAAVDQFKVQESFLMPDQGPGIAVVNIVTRSGNNQFHGEAYEFLRNRVFDARSFFAASREDLKRNQFGIAAGGPLRKDRLWFYGFYEGLREITAFSAAGYSPTAEMFTGDLAAVRRPIYDPATYSADTRARQPFPDSRIPPNRINTVARNLLSYYLSGNSLASLPNNVYGNPRKALNDDQGGLRVDWALGPRSQFFAQTFLQSSPSAQPGLYPLSGLLYLNSAQFAVLQHVWSAGPQAVNSFRLGYLRNVAVGGNEAQGQGVDLEQVGIANTFDKAGISAINLQGYSSFGRSNGEIGNRDNVWQFDDHLAYSSGAHTFVLGGGIRYRRGWHLNGNTVALGNLTFERSFSAQLIQNAQGQLMPSPNTGDAFADFLLGMPVNGLVIGLPAIEFRSPQMHVFLQDSWRPARNFTLNYGVSWFLDPFPAAKGWAREAVHGFDRQTGLLRYAALGEMNTHAAASDLNNFAPRLGLAWRPAFLGTTVIRAAGGIFYSEMPWFLAPYPITSGSPYTLGRNFTNPQTEPVPAYTLGVNVFPPGPAAVLTSSYAASLPPGTVATAINPSLRTAYTSQWNVSLQHSAGLSGLFEVSYLGSSSHRLPNPVDLSQCRPAANQFCDAAARPWPRYGLVLYGDSSGNSSYSALVARYEHRIHQVLNLRFEYAFGKVLTDSWQSLLGIHNQISRCRKCSKALATFDVRHRAAGSVISELPFGRGRRYGATMPRWADAFAGGWSVSGIVTFATGQPVALRGPNQTGSTLIAHLPNRVCDGRSDGLSGNIRDNGFLWFDTSCFPVPPVGYFGNSAPTVLSGPGLQNWDLGIEKSVAFEQKAPSLRIRAEMFNAGNRAQFLQPNGNAGAGESFGRISATRPPRVIQLALKLLW
jgi:hypothetical protein